MGLPETKKGILSGCVLVEQSTPDMTLNAGSGAILLTDSVANVAASPTLAFSTSDPSNPRWDLVEIDNTGSWVVTTGTPTAPDSLGQVPRPARTYTRVCAGHVWVGAAVTALHNADIDVFERDIAITPTAPADTLLYTFLSGGISAADPGAGNFGFNANTNTGITNMYISTTTPSGGVNTEISRWFNGHSGALPPYILRISSRGRPSTWWECLVTGVTDHTSWLDVAVTPLDCADGTVGAFGGLSPSIPTDTFAAVFEYVAPSSSSLTHGQTWLSSDQSIASASWTDGPNTGSLASGTWLVRARATLVGAAGTPKVTIRLWDGTTTYDETENSVGGATSVSMATVEAFVPGGATYKVSARGTATGTTMKAAAVDNSAGNLATEINWMKVG